MTKGDQVLATHHPRVRRMFERIFEERGVRVYTQVEAREITSEGGWVGR